MLGIFFHNSALSGLKFERIKYNNDHKITHSNENLTLFLNLLFCSCRCIHQNIQEVHLPNEHNCPHAKFRILKCIVAKMTVPQYEF